MSEEQMTDISVKKPRNEYIDFLRGIAMLGVPICHTAFWYGQSYVPEWFRNLTLLFDMPFFFYLSGWSSSFRKADVRKSARGVMGIWYKWVFFVTILALYCCISRWLPVYSEGVLSLGDYVNNLFFNVSFPGIPVLGGSIWFLPYYILVVMINAIVLVVIQKNDGYEKHQRTYMWLLLATFVWTCFGQYFMGLNATDFLFYAFFWMMGLNGIFRQLSVKKGAFWLAVSVAGFYIMSKAQGLRFYDIQNAKFPTATLKFFFFCLIPIILAGMLNGRLKHFGRFLPHVGRNSMFYFFAQNVVTSWNGYAVEYIRIDNWFVKWIITAVIAVAGTIILAELLALLYKPIEKCAACIADKVKNIYSTL